MPTQTIVADQIPPYLINLVVTDLSSGWKTFLFELEFMKAGAFQFRHNIRADIKDGVIYINNQIKEGNALEIFNEEIDTLNQRIIDNMGSKDVIDQLSDFLHTIEMELNSDGILRVKKK